MHSYMYIHVHIYMHTYICIHTYMHTYTRIVECLKGHFATKFAIQKHNMKLICIQSCDLCVCVC